MLLYPLRDIAYTIVKMHKGKMATRSGTVVLLEDFMEKAESEELKVARYTLVLTVKQVMTNCFTILGIEPIEKM